MKKSVYFFTERRKLKGEANLLPVEVLKKAASLLPAELLKSLGVS